MTSRLLGLNSATGNFEYITTDDTGALIVSQPESLEPIGSYGNLHNGDLIQQSATADLDVSLFRESIISYSDLSLTSSSTLCLYGSTTNPAVNWHYLGKIVPILNLNGAKREGVAIIKLEPFKKLIAFNESPSDVLVDAVISVVSH